MLGQDVDNLANWCYFDVHKLNTFVCHSVVFRKINQIKQKHHQVLNKAHWNTES